ncbi:MAG TPA: alpha/beta hydrolase [Blastocatellia bacterium]|nr:alpha/beta hydrolase [Blastocatellia bacterium]
MKTAKTIPVENTIELASGVKLQYVEQGDATGTPVVFLHGITDSWRSFEPVLPHLPASIHAFAISQRGHGDSDRPAAGYRTRDFAADIAAFLDAFNIERAVIAGHSMGSIHARRFALDYPERTLGLVIMGSFLAFQGNPEVASFRDDVSNMTDPVAYDFALDFQLSTLASPIAQSYLETVVQESLKVPARVWRDALEGLLEDDQTAELERIASPTLIVWGDKDAFCPASDQQALLAAIAGSRLVTYPDVGHALHWEEPERFAADFAAFAEKLVE